MKNKIPFNKPYLSGKELDYIADAVNTGKTSGNQKYSKQVHNLLCQKPLKTVKVLDGVFGKLVSVILLGLGGTSKNDRFFLYLT